MWGHIQVFTVWIHRISVMVIAFALTVASASAIEDYSDAIDPMLDMEPAEEQTAGTPKVTAVYGVSSDDYLPMKEEARQHLRPNLRHRGSRVSFDLPDAFFFIGGPIFLLIFLRVLVIFLNIFEENRKEEMRVAASEHAPKEHMIGK